MLSVNIGDDRARQRFVDSVRDVTSVASGRGGTKPGGAAVANPGIAPGTASARPSASVAGRTAARAPLDQAFIDRIAGKLAVYMGPIAKILARKAAQQTDDRAEFVRRLAEHLGAQERGAFLRDVGFGGY